MSDAVTHRTLDDILRRLEHIETLSRIPYGTGTWAPVLVGSGTAGTFTYAASTAGTYTRMGNTIHVRGRVAITVVTVAPTGNLSVRGLPRTSATVTSGTAGGVACVYWGKVNIGGGAKVYLAGWIQSASTQIDLAVSDSAGGAAVFLTGAAAGIAANSDLVFWGSYQI